MWALDIFDWKRTIGWVTRAVAFARWAASAPTMLFVKWINLISCSLPTKMLARLELKAMLCMRTVECRVWDYCRTDILIQGWLQTDLTLTLFIYYPYPVLYQTLSLFFRDILLTNPFIGRVYGLQHRAAGWVFHNTCFNIITLVPLLLRPL